MGSLEVMYDCGYMDRRDRSDHGDRRSRIGIRQARLELISRLVESALYSTDEAYNVLVMEILKEVYGDAYTYPSLYVPLGAVHTKIKIFCPVHDLLLVSSFYNHIVPARNSSIAVECPRCILDGNIFY